MTDSGTFQSYVYGDVEVSVEEIVRFQASIGVDIGTMLDVFGRPDMTRKEIEDAVRITAERATKSLQVADTKIMLNGPIQGGLHQDLRAKSAKMMAESEYQQSNFSIHPIGGIVPLMESQRYHDLLRSFYRHPPNYLQTVLCTYSAVGTLCYSLCALHLAQIYLTQQLMHCLQKTDDFPRRDLSD